MYIPDLRGQTQADSKIGEVGSSSAFGIAKESVLEPTRERERKRERQCVCE